MGIAQSVSKVLSGPHGIGTRLRHSELKGSPLARKLDGRLRGFKHVHRSLHAHIKGHSPTAMSEQGGTAARSSDGHVMQGLRASRPHLGNRQELVGQLRPSVGPATRLAVCLSAARN